jgi:hypothetical protein
MRASHPLGPLVCHFGLNCRSYAAGRRIPRSSLSRCLLVSDGIVQGSNLLRRASWAAATTPRRNFVLRSTGDARIAFPPRRRSKLPCRITLRLSSNAEPLRPVARFKMEVRSDWIAEMRLFGLIAPQGLGRSHTVSPASTSRCFLLNFKDLA